ncbi:acyl-CoA thioesterase [Flavobacteriaceae bacterium TP-CH-4]|uniref:Acyl-CoA thioesterase n=1 Tax=Pelagihabitans pacificus TaxID=2696054 RepID=A0A967ARY7_9FLAO|nr:acyl-ACP thioesterase domain-containing protein [Pelagihabitans pacificus]NHF59271.1 acyl-CoA thioesterase [Pelagihabitans pacificus]
MAYFEKIIVVSEDDLDELEHVNNVRYVQWIQDISKAHWQTIAPLSLQRSVAWVVMHHDITYRNAAKLNDELRIKTYIEKSRGAISTRIVEISLHKTNTLLIRSITKWCLLNSNTFKPMRISDDIMKLFEKH